jgi:hypothetical protein
LRTSAHDLVFDGGALAKTNDDLLKIGSNIPENLPQVFSLTMYFANL